MFANLWALLTLYQNDGTPAIQYSSGNLNILGSSIMRICLEHHVAEHRQEKDQKAITEPLGGHPAGRGLAAGAFKVCPQLAEQLTPSAEVVAKVYNKESTDFSALSCFHSFSDYSLMLRFGFIKVLFGSIWFIPLRSE